MPKLIFLWHFNFSLLSFILFKYTLNKLSLPSKIYIFSVFIFYQTVTLTTHNPSTQHKHINLERTHQTQQTKNETSKHFGPSTNPLNWKCTQQLYTPNQHKPNHNSNRPKSTIQISRNPTQQICKPTQITNPNPNPNFLKEKTRGPNLFFFFIFSEGEKRT